MILSGTAYVQHAEGPGFSPWVHTQNIMSRFHQQPMKGEKRKHMQYLCSTVHLWTWGRWFNNRPQYMAGREPLLLSRPGPSCDMEACKFSKIAICCWARWVWSWRLAYTHPWTPRHSLGFWPAPEGRVMEEQRDKGKRLRNCSEVGRKPWEN